MGTPRFRFSLRCVRTMVILFVVTTALVACGIGPARTSAPSAGATVQTQPSATQKQSTVTKSATAVPTPTLAPGNTVQPGVDLAVWSSHDKVPAKGVVLYHVYYANLNLDLAAEKVVLQITAPEGAKLVKVSRDSQPLPAGNGVEVTLGTLQPSASGSIEVSVEWPDVITPGTWTVLTAKISGSQPDPDTTNNTALDGERIPGPNLVLVLRPADDSGPFAPSASVSYLLGYSNTTNVDAISATITVTLPKGMTYRNASGGVAGKAVTATVGENTLVSLPLSPIRAYGKGNVTLQVTLDAGVMPDQSLTCSASIRNTAEMSAENNLAENTQHVQASGPDVWVSLGSTGATELGGKHTYRIQYGSRGTAKVDGVSISFLLPAAIDQLSFSVKPTTLTNGLATWQLGALQAVQPGKPIEITGIISKTGLAAATAEIASSVADANPSNNAATVTDDFVALQMPIISGPSNAIVGAQPVFYGLGKPKATVSLYLAGVDSQPGQLLGTGLVDSDGRWEITPTMSLPEPGWHWFTATQQLGNLVSPITGTANFASADLATDSNSLTVNGQRVGGIDQAIAWPEGKVLTFGARIAGCDAPVSPTLLVIFYDNQDVVVNHQVIQPKRIGADGYVEFEFQVPRVSQEVQWQISLEFYCPIANQTSMAPQVRRVAYVAGIWDWIKRKIDCWFGDCKDPPPPPPPPQPCEGCTPLDPKRKPKPDPFAPDNERWASKPFELLVDAGAQMGLQT